MFTNSQSSLSSCFCGLCVILCALCVEAEPFVLRRSAEWIPATPCTAVAPGSALDFSRFGFADGPCGKYGRIVARGEHFEFENRPGVPLRFMGVNLCTSGNYLPPDDSRRLVDNLVRLGYNSIRLHHHDDAWWKDYLTRRRGGAEDEKCQKPQLSINVTNENTNLRASVSPCEKTNPVDPVNPVKDNFAPSVSPREDTPISRLDALIAACREKGVYVTTDLYVSRKVTWRDIGEDRDGNAGDFKVLIHFHEGAMSNYLAFARSFLGHVNPHTGVRYADDPTLAWLSLVNEGNLGNWDIRPFRTHESLVLPKWRAWLAERRAENPEYAKVPDTLPEAVLEIPKDDRVVAFDEAVKSNTGTFSAKAHVIAFQQFLASLEADFLRRMRTFLRDEMGCKALVTNMNGWRFTAPEQPVRASFDYVDDHFYYAHPAFLGPSWSLPARITDIFPTNIRKYDEFGVPYNVTRRLFGRPFTVSEYNYCPPWSERASCAFLLGATAALQDWSALWRFCWTCSDKGAVDSSKKSLNHFDMAGDPVATLTERAIFCLFLRRDLPEHDDVCPVLSRPSKLAKLDCKTRDPTDCPTRWAAWRAKVGGFVGEELPATAKGMPELRASLGGALGDVIESPDGAVRVDRSKGSITVDTQRTAGGFVEKPGVVETRGFRAEIKGGCASVWASSLDALPISESGRILVCLVGDVQNDGIEYEDETMSVLLHWGKQEGRIAHRVTANLSIALAEESGWHVYALKPDGSRKREIKSRFSDSRLIFRADVGGDPNEAEFYYEISAK